MILAFGSNSKGQIGAGTEAFVCSPQQPKVFRQLMELQNGDDSMQKVTVFAGEEVVFFLTPSAELYGVGNNDMGQLGTGVAGDCVSPQKIHLLCKKRVLEMASARTHSVCVTDEGVFTFGNNTSGELGLGYLCFRVRVPQCIQLGKWGEQSVTIVVCGEGFTVICTNTGKVYGWGNNTLLQLGFDASEANLHSPVEIPIEGCVCALASGQAHTIALTTEGKVFTFGCNRFGQLGKPTCPALPVQMMDLPLSIIASAVAAGDHHSCVCVDDGYTVLSMGSNTYGQLMLGHLHPFESSPQRMRLGAIRVSSIACSSSNTYCGCSSGVIWGAGDNSYGQLGHSHTALPFSSQPVCVYKSDRSCSFAAAGHSVYVCEGVDVRPRPGCTAHSPLNARRRDVLDLLQSRIACDMVIATDTDEIPVHSALVLARCPRIRHKGTLERESETQTKKIRLRIGTDVVRVLLKFIYGDDDCLQDLCVAGATEGSDRYIEQLTRVLFHAHELGLPRLEMLANRSVEAFLTQTSACTVLKLAAERNIPSLVSVCIAYMGANYDDVMRGDGAVRLAGALAAFPDIIAQLFRLRLPVPALAISSEAHPQVCQSEMDLPANKEPAFAPLPVDTFEDDLHELLQVCKSEEVPSDDLSASDFLLCAGSGEHRVHTRVHSFILAARSGFFRAILGSCGCMHESQTRTVTLKTGFDPSPSALHGFIRFLYTGTIGRLDAADALHVLGLIVGEASAEREEPTAGVEQGFFQIVDHDFLVSMCLERVREGVTPRRAPALLCTAYTTGDIQAMDFLAKYVAEHVREISPQCISRAFAPHPTLAIEVLCRLAQGSEADVDT